MEEQSTQLITPKEFACFEGLKLLEKLLISGQMIPALEVKYFLRKAESFELSKALFVAKLMNLGNAYQFLEKAGAHRHSFDDDGNSLLSEAVVLNCPQRVCYLLKLHSAQHLFNKHDIVLAGRLAAQRGYGECLRLLLNVKSFKRQLCFIYLNTQRDTYYHDFANNMDYTPLYLAASNGKPECVLVLLDFGLNVDGPIKRCSTPLFVGCEKGHLNVVKVLLEAGADVNTVTRHGRNILLTTLLVGSVNCARELIKAGTNVNCQDNSGRTPLHIAASDGLTEIATMLIEAGADLDARDICGWTALHRAVNNDNVGVVRLLIASGADVSANDEEGKLVKDLAKSEEIHRLLGE